MKRLLFITLACLFALPAVAQIEMNNDGAVGIGGYSPNNGVQLGVSTNLDSPYWGMIVGAAATPGSGGFIIGTMSTAGGGAGLTYGVDANAGGAGGDAIGVRGHASGGDQNYGGFFWESGGSSATNYAAYFSGTTLMTGDLLTPSDARFKENVEGLTRESSLERLLQLRPVSFTYTPDESSDGMRFPEGRRNGFIAQELETVFPEFVSEARHPAQYDTSTRQLIAAPITYKALNYIQLIPILVQAIQEQQEEIEELRILINQLSN